MMKIGTHYAYWNNMWAADYIALCHRAKKCGLDVLEVGAGDLVTMSDSQLEELRTTAKDLGLEISANLGPPKDTFIFAYSSYYNPMFAEITMRWISEVPS